MTDRGLNDRYWLTVLWRRKWIVLATLILFIVVAEGVTATLTRVYSTSATLIVAQPSRTSSFDTTQTDEEAARSYSDVLTSPNFADQVAAQIGHGATGSQIQSAVSIQPVAQTQLIKITASSPSPARAQQIADAYANVFVGYAPRLEAQTRASATLADSAPLPTSPTRPKPTLYGIVAALLGLAAGIALAFLRERFDVRIRTLDDLAKFSDLSVIADIPLRSGSSQSVRPFAEAFRLLRTNLRVLDSVGAIHMIAITSWSAGEGKTTLASQLALSFTASGTDTLIVDGDVQRPSIPRVISHEEDVLEPGLSDYVLGLADAEDAIHDTRVPALRMMPSGRQVPNLSSVIETPRGRDAFTSLRDYSQVVVVDCPPLGVGADAPTIASQVDGVILVVDLSKATTVSLRRAIARLESANATIIGLAANRDAPAAMPYYEYGATTNGASKSRAARVIDRARRVRS